MSNSKRKRIETEPMEIDDNQDNQDDDEEELSAQNDQTTNNNVVEKEVENELIIHDADGGMRFGDVYIPPAPKPALTFDVNGPRLIITHIVNENFKSYAGQQVLGPFHKSFTSIVGPNGSGKSNVIDSMLFVFGYRASKIRSNKISSLLHSSNKFQNVTSGSVAVHFCQVIDGEGENFTVVPNSEIVVSRTAFKDSSSFYTLNGKKVQFKEVAKMLRSYGIDLDHNRFLILQGEVEQIAMMKPKAQNEHETGMLEYLGDIIGTHRYKEPMEQLNVKVEDLCEARIEKLNRVRLVADEKARLLQPMKEAVEHMNLSNAIIRTKNTLLQKYIHETNLIIEKKERDLNELKDNLKAIDEKLDILKRDMKEKNSVLKAGTEKYGTLQKQKDEITEKLQSIKRNTLMAQSDIVQANKKSKNLEQLLEQEKGKLIEFELVPEKNKKDMEDCKKLSEKHKEAKDKADEEFQTVMAGIRANTLGLQEVRDKLKGKMIDLMAIVEQAQSEVTLAESALQLYMSTEIKESERLVKMKESYERAVTELEEKTKLQKELSLSLPKIEKRLSEEKAQMQALKREEAAVYPETRTLRGQLEESKQTMSANTSRNRILNALMTEHRNGNFPGFFGRLGDLGGISAKYDVAISTCCGALDYIVVDTIETAQDCVEFLKNGNLGRATFVALDKQQYLIRQYERKVTFPENVPRLFDLVKVKDDRVLPAFYFALHDTLVANDLDQASRIAYGAVRHRVVTLKGEVIETVGTMSGGGKTLMRGRMSSSVQQDTRQLDPRVVQEQEERLASLENRLANLRAEQVRLDESVLTLEGRAHDERAKLNRVNVEVKSLTEQVPSMKNQLKQQEKKVASSKADPRRRAQLEEAIAVAQEKLEEANKNAGKVRKEVEVVEAKISAVAGGKMKELSRTMEELTKKIEKVDQEIIKLQVATNTSLRNAKKSKEKIQLMQEDLTETIQNLENLNSQKRRLTLEGSDLQKQLEEVDEKLSEGSSEFTELKQEIANLQNEENKAKGDRLEAANEVSKKEKNVQDSKNKMPTWQNELTSLKLQDAGVDGVEGVTRPEPLVTHTNDELEGVTVEELRNKLAAQKGRLGETMPNIQAILDYKNKEELYLKRATELEEITTERNKSREIYDKLKKMRDEEFISGVQTITIKLKEMYQMITLGGDADIEPVDAMNVFQEGVNFNVRPSGKSWKVISNLSGGEKTLASLALVFALHYYKPTPLYVMDEIDAALDFKNVSIIANYIKERTRNAQFIIISLRSNMFELCNRLVGIYKTGDCTQSVSLDNVLPVREDIVL